MQSFPPNPAFRLPGAGREFLLPTQLTALTGAGTRYYLIHNDRLFWDESEEYIRGAASTGTAAASPMMPGYDVIRRALKAGGFRAALPKVSATLVPNDEFDPAYLRTLFQRAYRQSRMDREWVEEFPGLRLGRSEL
jgi:hypothetical protein